jgi:hypothetical protein
MSRYDLLTLLWVLGFGVGAGMLLVANWGTR